MGDITPEAFNARFDFMASRNDTYYVLVVCDESDEVVGTGAVVVERKFIHDLGRWNSPNSVLSTDTVARSCRSS